MTGHLRAGTKLMIRAGVRVKDFADPGRQSPSGTAFILRKLAGCQYRGSNQQDASYDLRRTGRNLSTFVFLFAQSWPREVICIIS